MEKDKEIVEIPNDYILVTVNMPHCNKIVEVIMDNGEKTIGYYYDNWNRSGWMTRYAPGLFANQIWSGIKVLAWKEQLPAAG